DAAPALSPVPQPHFRDAVARLPVRWPRSVARFPGWQAFPVASVQRPGEPSLLPRHAGAAQPLSPPSVQLPGRRPAPPASAVLPDVLSGARDTGPPAAAGATAPTRTMAAAPPPAGSHH